MLVKSFTTKSLVLLPLPQAVWRSSLGANTSSCAEEYWEEQGKRRIEEGLHEGYPEIPEIRLVEIDEEMKNDRRQTGSQK